MTEPHRIRGQKTFEVMLEDPAGPCITIDDTGGQEWRCSCGQSFDLEDNARRHLQNVQEVKEVFDRQGKPPGPCDCAEPAVRLSNTERRQWQCKGCGHRWSSLRHNK